MIKQIFSVGEVETDKRPGSSCSVWKSLSRLFVVSAHARQGSRVLIAWGQRSNAERYSMKCDTQFMSLFICLLSWREQEHGYSDFVKATPQRSVLYQIRFIEICDIANIVANIFHRLLFMFPNETGYWLKKKTNNRSQSHDLSATQYVSQAEKPLPRISEDTHWLIRIVDYSCVPNSQADPSQSCIWRLIMSQWCV